MVQWGDLFVDARYVDCYRYLLWQLFAGGWRHGQDSAFMNMGIIRGALVNGRVVLDKRCQERRPADSVRRIDHLEKEFS